MRSLVRHHLGTFLVAAVTSMVFGAGAATAIIANAHKVDGYHANQLNRGTEGHADGFALDGVDGTVKSVDITAPKKGYLLMISSSEIVNSASSDTVVCALHLDGTEVTSSRRLMRLEAGTVVTNDNHSNCATNAMWPVASGAHTVSLVASSVGSGTVFGPMTLNVVFVPFAKGGAVPAPVPVT